jgi:ATP-dependent Clp protease ATP-binding subunit ClpA
VEAAVDDLDIPHGKLAESAERVVDRALEEARRREHVLLTNEHLCLAFAHVEWDTFGQVMHDLELNPHEILQALDDHLRMLPVMSERELRVAPSTKLLFKLALLHAGRSGRHSIEASDLFSAIFEETQGVPVSIIRRHGIEPEALVTRLTTRMRDHELLEERLKKRFELPAFLKHFATNLNQLARQDRIAPAFGRDHEMDQVLEILCHRERANSVLLLGEPGVGKTAIAEGLARRIEFEPEKVPVRLRDCQIVNLQMNTIVAGTMLRGMFEDRVQSIIREIRERPNLILFIDEVHTMIGAGSALGAPADAANIFKSVLARGDVRIIGATTLSEYKEFLQEDEALARRSTRRGRFSTSSGRDSSETTPSASGTKPSRPRSRCRRATCGISTFPTRSSAGSTRRPSVPRSTGDGKSPPLTWFMSYRPWRRFPRTWCSGR